MNRKYLLGLAFIWIPLLPASVLACGFHFTLNPDDYGVVGGTVVRMAGLAPPEPVFELEHPAMAKTLIGEKSEITVNYSRPFFSKNVVLKVSGTSNIQLFQEAIELDDRSGTVSIPYQLSGSGFDSITLTVSGEHKGEVVREVARIYIRAKSE